MTKNFQMVFKVCPYCKLVIPNAALEDRTTIVFWYSYPDGQIFAHTSCWIENELANGLVRDNCNEGQDSHKFVG